MGETYMKFNIFVSVHRIYVYEIIICGLGTLKKLWYVSKSEAVWVITGFCHQANCQPKIVTNSKEQENHNTYIDIYQNQNLPFILSFTFGNFYYYLKNIYEKSPCVLSQEKVPENQCWCKMVDMSDIKVTCPMKFPFMVYFKSGISDSTVA